MQWTRAKTRHGKRSQCTEVLPSYSFVGQVTGSKQLSLRMRFTAKSTKQRAGARGIRCLALMWYPCHCLAQRCLEPIANLASMTSHFGTLLYTHKWMAIGNESSSELRRSQKPIWHGASLRLRHYLGQLSYWRYLAHASIIQGNVNPAHFAITLCMMFLPHAGASRIVAFTDAVLRQVSDALCVQWAKRTH